MNNQLQVILDEKRLTDEHKKQVLEAFGAPFEQAGEILKDYINKDGQLSLSDNAIKVTSEDDFTTMAEARDKRIILKKVRTGVENKRKELGGSYYETYKAINDIASTIKDPIKPVEEYLETQEKFAELKEAERKAAKKAERLEQLNKLEADSSMYNLDEMTDEKFAELVTKLEADINAAKEAAEKAEAERLAAIEAEKKRQAEIEAENAKLRAEAEAREKEAAAERAKLQAEAEAKLAIERAAADEERRKREAIEAEQRAKAEAEAKAKRDAEEAERAALLSPDKQKIETFADALKLIREQKLPAVKSKQAQDIINNIEAELQKIEVNARRAAQNL